MVHMFKTFAMKNAILVCWSTLDLVAQPKGMKNVVCVFFHEGLIL
jgi:hypothetical protein